MSRNISREKRENLLSKIQELRTFLDGANATPTMKAYLSELESELKRQKFGLVFEEHKEEIDEILETHTPVLTEDKSLFIDNGGPMHFLIEGDNLAALTLLEKTHKGKIDVIYIDPPYNTENKDFIYDDSFVAKEDGFRHSKWLSFMKVRLCYANKLLSNKGIIFISIDDNEQAQIKLLCNSIFGETSFVAVMPRRTINSGKHDSNAITVSHDYILIYSKLGKSVRFKQKSKSLEEKDKLYPYQDEYIEKRGRYYITQLNKNSIQYSDSLNYAITAPDGSELWPGEGFEDKKWVWRWSKAKLEWGIKNGFIVFKKNRKTESYKVYTKSYELMDKDGNPIERTNPNTSLDFSSNEYTNFNATPELEKIMGDKKLFDYPKPILLIKSLLSLVNSSDYSILDFFAGSGTTGHAVMELNKQDGGNRKFILCTNNENGICRNVTYERIKTVITGKRKDGTTYGEPLPSSLKYQRIDFIPTSEQTYYDYAAELLLHIRELVELENAINFEGNNDLAILLTEDEVEQFFASEEKLNSVKTIYLGHDIALTLKQQRQVTDNNVTLNVIPEYYYKEQQI